MEPENKKHESVNKHETKKKQKCWPVQEYILQQNPENTKVQTQGDMKAWNAIIMTNPLLTNLVQSR